MHHWLGVLFGAFFFVTCVSGVFVMVLQAFDTAPEGRQLSNAQILDDIAVFERRGLFPDDADLIVTPPKASRAGYLFRYGNGLVQVYDDAQAAPRARNQGSGFATMMWNIHANLLNLFGIGHSIVIWSGMVGAYLALLGVIIFIPRRRTFRKNSILHPQELSFREVRRAHFSSGIVFFICVIFFGITGWAAGAPNVAEDILRPRLDLNKELPPPENFQTLTQLLELEHSGESSERLTQIRFDLKNRESLVFVYLTAETDARTRRRVYSRDNGQTVSLETAVPTGFAASLNFNMAEWHSGKGGGFLAKLLLCLSGLIAGLIALTGLISYIWRWKIQIAGWLRRRNAKDKAV